MAGFDVIRQATAVRRVIGYVPQMISADGTLGFTFGRAEISWRDEKGEVQKRESRYTTLWRKQKDGTYKVVFDIGG